MLSDFAPGWEERAAPPRSGCVLALERRELRVGGGFREVGRGGICCEADDRSVDVHASSAGSLVGQLAERDPLARAGLADGFERWEAHLRDGLERMQTRGRLSANADPATLATATMALLQGGLLLTQVRRDPKQLRTALAAARVLLRSAAA
jgi:hypothetical protein